MTKAAEFAVILKMNPIFADLGTDELQRISSLCRRRMRDCRRPLVIGRRMLGLAV
jgi:hypothetical protein